MKTIKMTVLFFVVSAIVMSFMTPSLVFAEEVLRTNPSYHSYEVPGHGMRRFFTTPAPSFWEGTKNVREGKLYEDTNFTVRTHAGGFKFLGGKKMGFYKDGAVNFGSLSKSYSIEVRNQGAVKFSNGSSIYFYQNGAVQSGYLAVKRTLYMSNGHKTEVAAGEKVFFSQQGYYQSRSNNERVDSDIEDNPGVPD